MPRNSEFIINMLFDEQEARFEAAPKLQKKISLFLNLETPAREDGLADLIKEIYAADLNIESLHFITDPKANRFLEEATKKASQIEYVGVNGTTRPFGDSHATVVLDRDGVLIAAAAEPYGNVNLAYADPEPDNEFEKHWKLANLLSYALAKAVIAAHVERAGRADGLDTDENWDYVRRFLPADVPLFLGAAVVKEKGVVKFVVGESGAEQNEDFLKSVLGKNFNPKDVNQEAGAGDQHFAEAVGQNLLDPESKNQVTEPEDWSLLRANKLSPQAMERRN